MKKDTDKNISVKDIMTKNVITVNPNDSLIYAAKLLNDYNFNGLPVVDKNKKVVGLLTEYDLILKGLNLHLPTLIQLLSNIKVYRKDSTQIKGELKKILYLKVFEVMNENPVLVNQNETIKGLANLFAIHKVNPIPVVNDEKRLVGIVSRFDLVRFYVGKKPLETIDDHLLDKEVKKFISNFEKRFIFVSRARIKFWFLWSLIFAIVGFIIAFAIILRITIE